MNSRLAGAVNGFLIALMFAVALWALDALPAGARIAVHWGVDGAPDRWMGKWVGMLTIPLFSLALCWLGSLVPEGAASPGKLPLPPRVRRALLCCVLLIQALVQVAIAYSAMRQ